MALILKPGAGVQPRPAIGGLAGWIASRFRSSETRRARLELVERIALGPRQTVALVEADGERFLVASSAEGGATFHPLNARPGVEERVRQATRVSW